MMEPFDRDDALDAQLRDGGAGFLDAADGLVGDLDDVRARSHRQTIAFRATAASITAVIVLLGVVGISRGRGAAPPTQFDSASPAPVAPSSSSSTTTAPPPSVPPSSVVPGPTVTAHTAPPTTAPPVVPDESTTTSTTTEETPPSTDAPPVSVPPTTVPSNAQVAAAVAGLQLRGNGLGSLRFGSDAETVIFTLTAAFGPPSHDSGWTGSTRVVTWGAFKATFADKGAKTFAGWAYSSDGTEVATPKLQTSVGVTLSTRGADFNTLVKATANQGGSLCFDDGGPVCAGFTPPAPSGLVADANAVVVRLAAGAP